MDHHLVRSAKRATAYRQMWKRTLNRSSFGCREWGSMRHCFVHLTLSSSQGWLMDGGRESDDGGRTNQSLASDCEDVGRFRCKCRLCHRLEGCRCQDEIDTEQSDVGKIGMNRYAVGVLFCSSRAQTPMTASLSFRGGKELTRWASGRSRGRESVVTLDDRW